MMEQLIVDFNDRFKAAFDALETSLDQLPSAALDWAPGPEMNSATVLISHIVGSTRFWVGDIGLKDPSNRVRQSEFETKAITKEDLQAKLNSLRSYIEEGLTTVSIEQLPEMRDPFDDFSCSVGWALLHALEHMNEHVGHLGMLVQLWQAK